MRKSLYTLAIIIFLVGCATTPKAPPSEITINIAKDEIDGAMTNLNSVLAQANCKAKKRNGLMVGVHCESFEAGSIYEKLGFKGGDTFSNINGEAFSSPEKAFELLSKIENKNLRNCELSVIRNGRPLKLEYKIQ